MMRLSPVLCSLALTATLAAQTDSRPTTQPAIPEPAPALTNQEALAMLEKSCGKMAHLQGVRFSSVEEQENQFSRQLGGALGGNAGTEVVGRWSPRTVELEIGDADEVVIVGDRMIARDDEFDWSLRRDCLAGGAPLPFTFDPARFFETMQQAIRGNLEMTRTEIVTIRDQEFVVLSVTVEGDLAREFCYTGALPRVSEGGGVVMLGGIGGMGRRQQPDVTTDFAIYVDPESHLVHRILAKAYQDSLFGGNIQIQLGGLDAGDDEAEEVRTVDEHGNRIYKKGLPVRDVADDQSVLSFSVRFKDHGKPMLPNLDDAAREMLRMR